MLGGGLWGRQRMVPSSWTTWKWQAVSNVYAVRGQRAMLKGVSPVHRWTTPSCLADVAVLYVGEVCGQQ